MKGPHIDSAFEYVDRSGSHSVVLQAVVDSQGRFLDASAGWPRSVHDRRIFNHSPIGRKLLQSAYMQTPIAEVEGEEIKPYLIGDAGYTLESFMVVPYPGKRLEPVQAKFNEMHYSTRMTVECAFGRLKGRFRWLNVELFVRDPANFPRIIIGACILHNITMDQNDVYDEEWGEGVESSLVDRRPSGSNGISGKTIRDLLCKHFNRF